MSLWNEVLFQVLICFSLTLWLWNS